MDMRGSNGKRVGTVLPGAVDNLLEELAGRHLHVGDCVLGVLITVPFDSS